MLALEIEYLTGNAVAARWEDSAQVDWPPQPDRMFSALVASWGARGEDPRERAALEWLEALEPPRLIHGGCWARTAPTVYVPPNDFKTSKDGRFDVIPERRRRQARRFPTARLTDPLVRAVWSEDPDTETHAALDRLAKDTPYIGHSTSLTRCRFVTGSFDLAAGVVPARRVYPGRLRELESDFKAGRTPNPGASTRSRSGDEVKYARSIFSQDWIVLATEGQSVVPDILAFPIVARKLRDTLLSGYEKSGDVPPEWLSGHRSDGAPSENPHMALVPLADVGWSHSEGTLMGCAIVLPYDVPRDAIVRAIVNRIQDDGRIRRNGRTTIELHYGGPGPWNLRPSFEAERASLRPPRWFGLPPQSGQERTATRWRTVTPIALDRYPKQRSLEARDREIAGLIGRACVNVGMSLPIHVAASDFSSVRAAPPVVRGPVVPPWQHWRMPRSLKGRYLVHAQIEFPEPVAGPVILGAGRFVGLGLCLPADEERTS